jgi:superfamily II DNA or RNA helicase/HKD family nuclease
LTDVGGELPVGLYEKLLTADLIARLESTDPALVDIVPVAPADAHVALAQHLARLASVALRARDDDALVHVVAAVNDLIAGLDGVEEDDEALVPPLRELRAIRRDEVLPQRPSIPLRSSALLVNGRGEPRIGSELRREIDTADEIDLLCAFIKWSGLRLLVDHLRRFVERGGRLRIITTTYCGVTEATALDELQKLGAELRVSYDSEATRLHAKAWLFRRQTGFHTAFVGSSNLSHPALVDGVEWNVRVSAVDAPTILERFRSVFDTYWLDTHVEAYDRERFLLAVQRAATRDDGVIDLAPLIVTPYPHQVRILERLQGERDRHDRWHNLVVAATGTGKTVVAALDYKRLLEASRGNLRLLFVAHRREILRQSLSTFRAVLGDGAFGELHVGRDRAVIGEHVFASIQSLSSEAARSFDAAAFDVVIVDEFHHAEAATYQALLSRIKPRVLLGLTATPERADGVNVSRFFDGRIAAELRLWEALEAQLLAPFQYFGVHDDVDLSQLEWRRGGYRSAQLSDVYTGDDARVTKIVRATQRVVRDPLAMRALGFCVSQEHAAYMARRFSDVGIPSEALTADTPQDVRSGVIRRLRQREINALFTVDLFNEGVDIPEVDTLLLLRPTESATVFLQQLGRGLRRRQDKPCCTVLDFIGQQHRSFRFADRFGALTTVPQHRLERAIVDGFPELPSGCHIELDRVAQQIILDNVRSGIRGTRDRLTDELRELGPSSRLADLLRHANASVVELYRRKGMTFGTLRRSLGFDWPPPGPEESELIRRIRRFVHVSDPERVAAYRETLSGAAISANQRGRRYQEMLCSLLMPPGRRMPLASCLELIHRHPAVCAELDQLLVYNDEEDSELLHDVRLAQPVPLAIHARYTSEEVFAAFGLSTIDTPVRRREGVRWYEASQSDLLFVTLEKNERDFSPTTRYRDYAVSPSLFHWESQSMTTLRSRTGQRYRNHASMGTHVLLFARETNDDEMGDGQPFLLLGPCSFVSSEGERPIAITWRLDHPIPAEFFEAASAAAG